MRLGKKRPPFDCPSNVLLPAQEVHLKRFCLSSTALFVPRRWGHHPRGGTGADRGSILVRRGGRFGGAAGPSPGSRPGLEQEGRIRPVRRVGKLRPPTSGPVRAQCIACCVSRASLKASRSAELQPVAICPFLLKQTLYRLVLVKFMGCWAKH